MATRNEEPVRMEELGIAPEELESFSRTLAQYMDVRNRIRELEDEQKAAKEWLMEFLLSRGLEKAQYESVVLSYRVQERRMISREKLLRNGVRPDIIARSEDVTQFAVLDVREKRRKLGASEAMME
jgi:hypothetical protein